MNFLEEALDFIQKNKIAVATAGGVLATGTGVGVYKYVNRNKPVDTKVEVKPEIKKEESKKEKEEKKEEVKENKKENKKEEKENKEKENKDKKEKKEEIKKGNVRPRDKVVDNVWFNSAEFLVASFVVFIWRALVTEKNEMKWKIIPLVVAVAVLIACKLILPIFGRKTSGYLKLLLASFNPLDNSNNGALGWTMKAICWILGGFAIVASFIEEGALLYVFNPAEDIKWLCSKIGAKFKDWREKKKQEKETTEKENGEANTN